METVPGDEEPKVVLVVGGVCKDQDFAFYFEGNREPPRESGEQCSHRAINIFFQCFFYCDTSHIKHTILNVFDCMLQ